LEVDEPGGAVVIRLRPDPGETAAQPALERAEALPLQPVERIAGRVRLRDDVARELAAPVGVVTLAAREIELALAPIPGGAAGVEERLRARVGCDVDWHAARLARHERGQRQQLAAFPCERRPLLPVSAALIDALLEGDRPSLGGVERRMARGHALHARPGIAVAVG